MISAFTDLLYHKTMTCFGQMYLDFTLIICLFPLETQPWEDGDVQQGCCVPAARYRQVITGTGWGAKGSTAMKLWEDAAT